MKLHELKATLEKVQAEGITAACERDMMLMLADFISDVDFYMEAEDEAAPGKSDFEEHNTLNHSQQGIT